MTLESNNKLIENNDIKGELKNNLEKQSKEVFNYFNFSNSDIKKFKEKADILSKLNLNYFKLLLGYMKYINNNLEGLNSNILNKIKKSIKIKVLKSVDVVDNVLKEAKTRGDNILSYRWIINDKVGDYLGFINYKLLPTANIYIHRDKIDFGYFLKEKKIEEIEEMFNSKVDENGDFDEGFFSTQVIFDYESDLDIPILERNNIKKVIGVDMLSQKDRELEGNIMIKYIAFVSTMLLPYAGALTSVPSDLNDLFSDYEGTIKTMKMYGVLKGEELDYVMSKSYLDNIFGAVGLITTYFGAQGLIKSGKFVKVFNKLEKLGFSKEKIFSLLKKYENKFNGVINNSTQVVNNGISKLKIKRYSDLDLLKLDGKIKDSIDIDSIKKQIKGLEKGEKINLTVNINLDSLDNKKEIYTFFNQYFKYLSTKFTKEEINKLNITFDNKDNLLFDSEKKGIDSILNLLKTLDSLSNGYGIDAKFKLETFKIKGFENKTISYYSIADIIARASFENLHKYIVLSTKDNLDGIINNFMIESLSDSNRFSQYDVIVFNAVEQFNKDKDPKKFLKNIYFAIKDSKEFKHWEENNYKNGTKSGLSKLIKFVDKKGWLELGNNKKEFISRMWRGFDEIEYTNKKLQDILIQKGFGGIKKGKRIVRKILKSNGLELYNENIEFKFIDKGDIKKDGLLNIDNLNSDYSGVSSKAGYIVYFMIKDENGNPYKSRLFIPLDSSKDYNFIKPDFVYKEYLEKLDIYNQKIKILRGLGSESKNNIKLIEFVSKYISLEDLKKLDKQGVVLPKDILLLYSNLIKNGYYKKTTFYDFVINAPKDLRFFSNLDSKTILSGKALSKYNDYSFNSSNFEKIPSNYVSVYHYTSFSGLAKIAINGLIPRGKLIEKDIYVAANASITNLEIAKQYNKTAPKGFSRENVIYAYPKKKLNGEENQGKGGVCLEIKVDPKKALVVDADIVTKDSDYLLIAGGKAEVDGQEYWKGAITLEQYNKLSIEKQKKLFTHPEVIIPGGVSKDYIRIAE